uniref:Uncharacterized protein n=1 Tax=Talaromyces marneffei PM1 TaxID=1077442 RepID=A0A093XKK0_TALMA
MVSSPFRSDSVSSRMRKRFSLPAYPNKSLYADEQKQEFQYVDLDSSSRSPQPPVSVRPPLRTNDEARLRQAVTNLYEQVDRNEETGAEQQTEAPSEPTAAAAAAAASSEPGVKRTRPRRGSALDTLSSLSRRLSIVVEPTEKTEKSGPHGNFNASLQDEDPFLQFNGLLYNFEFGSPLSRSSRVFEAGTPPDDAGNSYGRYRPRNPAERAKRSRYSWGGFDLAHRNDGDAEDRDDDLISILEHDESNLNDAAAVVVAPAVVVPAASSPSQVRSKPPSRRPYYYQDNRRSGIVVDDVLADTIAAGALVHKDSTNNTTTTTTDTNNNNTSSAENIRAFIPLGTTAEQSETAPPEKKRGIIRRLSLSLFGRRKTDPLVRNSNMHTITMQTTP